MVDPVLMRSFIAFVLALAAGFGAGCTFYSPTIVDCSVTCTEGSTCPRGTACRNGFCRLESAMGDCACKLGDTRPCGGGRGECKPGTEVCSAERVWSGICVNEGKPGIETCNNKDDNCNGLIDDMVTDLQACSLTLGVCAGAKNRCESGSQLVCEASDYGSNYQADEQRCDGFDNDCDGFTDVKGSSVLSGAASATAAFQLLPVPNGFVLVFTRQQAAMPSELVVARFDEQLMFQRSYVVSRPAPLQYHARSLGDFVYVVTTVDGGVDLTRVNTFSTVADAGLEHFESVPDAGFTSGLRLGVGEQAVSTFLAQDDERARMFIWQLDGGLSQVRDVNTGEAPATVTLNSVNVSDRGHWVIYSAEPSSGDTVRELIRLGDGGVTTPPYYGGVDAELIEWDAGVSATYPYSSSSSSLSGIYYLPELATGSCPTLTTTGLCEVAAAASNFSQEWGAMGAVRTRSGDLRVAMQQRTMGGVEQIVVSTSVPIGSSFSFRSRNLDGGAGVPALVSSSDGAWLIVAWREMTQIRARRVCAP